MNTKTSKVISAAASTVGVLSAIVCFITNGVTNGIFAAVCAVCMCVVMYCAFDTLKLTRSPVYGKVPRAAFLFLALFAIMFAVYAFIQNAAVLAVLEIFAETAVFLWAFSMLKKPNVIIPAVFVVLVAVSQFGVLGTNGFYITMAVCAALLIVCGIIVHAKGGVYNSIGIATGAIICVLCVAGIVLTSVSMQPIILTALLALVFIMTLAGSFKTLIPSATLAERDMNNIKVTKQEKPAEIETAAKKGKRKTETPPLPNAVPTQKSSGNAYAKAVGRAYGGSTKIASAAATNAAAVANDAKNKIIDKQYQSLDWQQLLSAPVSALKGIETDDEARLTAALNIKTISDLADNKFFAWAKEINDNKG